MERTNEKDKYMIPVNVTTRFELISGIGWKEIGMILLAGIIGAILAGIIGIQTKPVEKMMYVETDEIINEALGSKKGGYELVTVDESILDGPQRFLFVVLPALGVAMILKKNDANQSVWDMIKNYHRYQSGQKRYEMKGSYYYEKCEAEAAKQKNGNHQENGAC